LRNCGVVIVMWSRAFHWIGIASGLFLGCLLAAAMVVTLDVIFAGPPPYKPYIYVRGLLALVLLGLITYPACWYWIVARWHDYSWIMTLGLVSATYVFAWAIAFVILLGVGLVVTVTHGPMQVFVFGISTVVVGVLLLPLYLLFALPIAFLHRA